MTSTEDEPDTQLVTEHLFVIADDDVLYYHSVHKAQELIIGYLGGQLQMKIKKLDGVTDGCAAQYKSCHRIGDLSCRLWIPDAEKFFSKPHMLKGKGCCWS